MQMIRNFGDHSVNERTFLAKPYHDEELTFEICALMAP
jgi:hypothetical protein